MRWHGFIDSQVAIQTSEPPKTWGTWGTRTLEYGETDDLPSLAYLPTYVG